MYFIFTRSSNLTSPLSTFRFPLVMNIIQFWVIDTIVKHSERQEISLGDQQEEEEIVNLLASEDDTELTEHLDDQQSIPLSPTPGDLERNASSKFNPAFAIDDDEADFGGHDAWDDDYSFRSISPRGNADTAQQHLYELDNHPPKRS